MPTTQLETVRWCATCCTRHSLQRECPGELAATGPEQHGWRVNVDTPRGMEAYGVLIARSDDIWRARILTYPNVLWIAPGTGATMKFVGKTPQEAERQATSFIKQHCVERDYRMRDGLMITDPGPVDPEQAAQTRGTGRDAAPRKIQRLPVLFGIDRARKPGVTDSVSESGLSIITGTPVGAGARVNLKLTFGGSRHALSGIVVWMRDRPELGRAQGMGVRLDSPPADYREYVRELH